MVWLFFLFIGCLGIVVLVFGLVVVDAYMR